MKETEQIKKWSGEFGKDYTNRNLLNPEELDACYLKNFGVTRTELNKEFLSSIDSNSRILEVGSNVGNQLSTLQKTGFSNLWGIEVSDYAVELSKKRTKGINLIRASALDIPFKDGFFDLVFTSGVLIHIHPQDLPNVIDEIYRVSNKYIWCYEYFSEACEEVKYRDNDELLWKNNFSRLFLERKPDLQLIREKKVKYKDNDNVDCMFMLEKTCGGKK